MCAVIIYSCAAEGETAFGIHSSRQRIKNMAEGERMVTCQLIKVVNCRPVVVGKGEDGKPIVKYEEVHDPKAPLNFVLVPGNKNDAEERPTGKIFLRYSNRKNRDVIESDIIENNSKVSVRNVVFKESDTLLCKFTESHADVTPSEKNAEIDIINKEATFAPPVKDDRLDISSELNVTSKKVKKLHPCKVCNKIFASKCDADIHHGCHISPTIENSYICDVCGKKFISGIGLLSHTRAHKTEKPFLCEVCGKKFLVRGNLLNHLKAHKDEETLTCSICEKSYKTRSIFSAHKRTHSSKILLYSCKACGKNFRMRGRYQRHLRVHQEEKKHCSICGLEFVSGRQLKKHIRTHAGEEPYTCEVCVKKCSSQEGLQLQKRQHASSKIRSCSECPKKFISHDKMQSHVRHRSEDESCNCKQRRKLADKPNFKKRKAENLCRKTKH